MSSKLPLSVTAISGSANTYEIDAGLVLFAGKTV